MNRVLFILLLLLNAQVGMSQRSLAVDSLGREVRALGDTLASRNRDQVALGAAVERLDEKVTQYYDMFKHQWTVFGVVITALSLVIVVFIPLVGFFTFRSFKNEVDNNVARLNAQLVSINEIVEKNENTTKKVVAQLLSDFAYSDILTSLNSEDLIYRFHFAYNSLVRYIQSYRLEPSDILDNKIRDTTSYLIAVWDDNTESIKSHLNETRYVFQKGSLHILVDDHGLRDDTRKTLLELFTRISTFFKNAEDTRQNQ
jgi:translation initiation factor 2B subunit (eIF-2B alpha/beta/delta family)